MTVVQRRDRRGNTKRENSAIKVVLNAEKDGESDNGNTARSTPGTKKDTKAPRQESACNEEHQNKKPRSDDEGSGGEESKQGRKGLEEKGGG